MFPLLIAIAILAPQGQINYDLAGKSDQEIWDFEQKLRNEMKKPIIAEKFDPQAIRQAIKNLEELRLWVMKPELRKTFSGQIYSQRNDILNDQIIGWARLKEVSEVARGMEELKVALDAPDSWLKGNMTVYFNYYVRSFQGNQYIAALLPNPRIEAVLKHWASLDPLRQYRPTPTVDIDNLTASDRVAGLSLIWSEAKYNFANFDLVPNLDWNQAYNEYLPKVSAAKSRYDYYNLLREFIALLRDSHTDVGLPRSLRAKHETFIPLDTALVENKVVIQAEPHSTFAKHGLRKGDVIRKIDGIDAVEYGRTKWGKRVSASTPQDAEVRMYYYMLLRGPLNSKVKLEIEDAKGVRMVTLPRDGSLQGTSRPTHEFKILPDGTAYFAFNTCGSYNPSAAFPKYLPEIRKAGRLVIDVRENDGGNSEVGYEILSHLLDKEVAIGKWETPTYNPSFRAWDKITPAYGESESIKPHADRFLGPVVVLSGPRTFSAAEDFLAAYKMTKRGLIIGMPSGGSTGQPLNIPLPGGGNARICTKRDRMADGTEFVGVGVIPEIRVRPTIAALRDGRDLVLEEALSVLRS